MTEFFRDIQSYSSNELEYIKQAMPKALFTPHLVVIQIGDDSASNSYIKGKQKDCQKVGFTCDVIKLNPIRNTTEDVIKTIKDVCYLPDTCGIIVQLPIPEFYDLDEIKASIPDNLDVDGFKPTSPFDPCTPKGIIDYLDYCRYPLSGKNTLVIGRSDIVGKPLARMLLEKDANVTVVHSRTNERDLYRYIRSSNIIFSCINKINFFNIEDFSEGLKGGYCPDIIDITLGVDPTYGILCGSFSPEFAKASKYLYKNQIISGTGGVGLLTRLALIQNVYKGYLLKTM